MNIKANAPSLEPSSQRSFNSLFYERIASLESLTSGRLVLSKQVAIDNLKKRILQFIKEHRYSWFEISILTNEGEVDKPLMSIKIRNFPKFIDDVKPNEYLIAIEPTWSDCQIYQLSPTGLRIKEIII